ncbi:TniQ family protein [Stenotrophomonas maltophilia]|uniref:TniQ family protein n=1 Tax=Stenotrophomonas maltophilia TaxID=40324 RepID=UPI00092F3A54
MCASWSRPIPGELLSSYVMRQAIAHGSSADKFTRLVLPHSSVWNRDLDVCAGSEFMSALCASSGHPPELLDELTLYRWTEVTRRSEVRTKGVYHWIGCLGLYHRTRRLHGQAFCPDCLGEYGGFLRQWRLSFWTVCPFHHRLLMDACPHCGAVVQPHRQDFDLRLCWSCSGDLTSCSPVCAVPTASQGLLFNALVGPSDWLEPCNFRCSGRQLLWGADVLLSAFYGHGRQEEQASDEHSRVEKRRIELRHADMELLDSLLAADARTIGPVAASYHVTQRCFRQEMPGWLQSLVALLPTGRVNKGFAAGRREIKAVVDAQRSRAPGWQELRADLLFKMIGRRA